MQHDEKIVALWNQVADRLLAEMEAEEVAPAMIANALRFLKDNEMEALPVGDNALEALAKSLPYPKVGVG